MAIKTKEPEVPRRLPPARLYLNDIQEIVEIFRAARNYEEHRFSGLEKLAPDSRETISFECGNKTCDTFDELKKIGGTTSKFKVEVANSFGSSHSLHIDRHGTSWLSYNVSNDGKWATYRKLESIYSHRKIRWRAAIGALGFWTWMGVSLFGNTVVVFLIGKFTRLWPNGAGWIFIYILLSNGVLALALFRNTVVVLQDSSEPSGFKGILSKSIPQIVGAILAAFLGVVGTLLVQYIHRKLWP